MKTTIVSIAMLLGIAAMAATASAQCAFDAPGKAAGMKISFVRAFGGCPSDDHPVINAETEDGTPACAPLVVEGNFEGEDSTYSFSDKGGCSLSAKAKLVADCADLTDASDQSLGLPTGPCHVTYLKVKCSGILNSSGDPIDGFGDMGFSLSTLTRATLDDPLGNDMTVIDFPVNFFFSLPDKGKMELSTNSAEALIPLVGADGAALPACTSLEIVSAEIQDAYDRTFARMGLSTR